MSDKTNPLQIAYERECAIIGAAYSIICEQKVILKAATARRAALVKQASESPVATADDESHNDRK